ncbi:MAG: ABC transporter permease [Bacteroidia bacterium]|nr:ABC transporter permease [Bacteroidia bacterium]
MAFQTLLNNKVRSILSVSGISIGIFSIVTVFTIIDSFELQVKNSLASLGKSVIYIEVFPWETEEKQEYPWWKFIQRPDPTIQELQLLEQSHVSNIIDAISYKLTYPSATLINIDNGVNANGIDMLGVSYAFNQIQDLKIAYGRYFSEQECNFGSPVIVLGNKVATQLFDNAENALGKNVRIAGKLLQVIGVMEYDGENMIDNSSDENVYVPMSLMDDIIGQNIRSFNPQIMVKAKDGVSIDALANEIKGAMRSIRRLQPNEDDNFAINKVTFLIQFLDEFFVKMNLFGLIIGGFALLVGGFGVANIMFVSVKERTGIIGIQKALGAKRLYILTQFLTEAIVLCVLGGIIGIAFVFLLTFAANIFLAHAGDVSFRIYLTMSNFTSGIMFSIITGIVAGIIPAWVAAKLMPVKAIRFNG